MEALLDWGYIGLFVGSFVAATVVPFSSDVLLVGMLAAGGNVWLSVLVATVGNWADFVLDRLDRPMGMDREIPARQTRDAGTP